jgi:HK97 family phage major capsid protein
MSYLQQVTDLRAATWERAKSMLDHAVSEKRDLSTSEQSDYDGLTADLAAQRSVIEHLKEKDASIKQSEASLRKLADTPRTLADPNQPQHRNWLPGLNEYRGMVTEQRAVGTTGAFISVGGSAIFFDQLRKRTAVLAAQPTVIPVIGYGSMKVPAVTASVTVSGGAEGAAITPSDPTFASITLDPKKFSALTLVDREAIEDSSPELQMVVANSLVKDFAVELDRQLLVGDGTGSNLTGLAVISGLTAGAATGTNGGAASFGFLADTLGAYEAANNDPDRGAWLMHPRTWASVRKLVDGNSRPIVSIDPTAAVRQTLWGKPVFLSSNFSITQTVGTSTDCSTILLADMSQVVVGVSRQVELQMSTDYAFGNDQVALRVTGRYDIGLPQPAAVVKTVGIRP